MIAIASIVGFLYLLTAQSPLAAFSGRDNVVKIKDFESSKTTVDEYAQQRRVQTPKVHHSGTKDETVEANIVHALRVKTSAKDAETLHFETSLKNVLDNTPDESQLEHLLSPIAESGKQRLHDTAVRARALKSMLEPWEDLHLVKSQDKTYVRDDILRYIQQADNLSSISITGSKAELIRSYEYYRSAVAKLSTLLFPWTAPYFADHVTLHAHIHHGGRGIVMSSGNRHIQHLLTSIKSLRQLGCNLPIEVMYLGEDDLKEISRTELELIPGVVTRNMKTMINDKGWTLRGWSGKSHAILLSSFREVIYIDADALFVQDPAVLFDETAYLNTGALFFYDQIISPESQSRREWLEEVLPKPISTHATISRLWTGESTRMQESGVIVVDKWQHFMALLFVTRMNGPDRDGNREKGIVGTYDMINSDKETFWIGFEAVGDTDYAFYEGEAANMGVARVDRGESPKIAATYERIAKHAELVSSGGRYENTVLPLEEVLQQGQTPNQYGTTTATQPATTNSSESTGTVRQQVSLEPTQVVAATAASNTPTFADDDEVRPNTLPPAGLDLETLIPAEISSKSSIDDDMNTMPNTIPGPDYASIAAAREKAKQDSSPIPSSKFDDDDAVRPNTLPPANFETIEEKAAAAALVGEEHTAQEDSEPSIYDSVREGDYDEMSVIQSSATPDSSSPEPTAILRKRNSILPAERQFQRGRTTTEKKATAWIHADQPDTQSEESLSYSKPIAKGQPLDESVTSSTADRNYTICSRQVLHLDTKGRPLWFSGGILEGTGSTDIELSEFQVFVKEKRGDGGVGSWSRREDGLSCLKSDRILRFTKQEKAILEKIVDTAGEVGALGENWTKRRTRR